MGFGSLKSVVKRVQAVTATGGLSLLAPNPVQEQIGTAVTVGGAAVVGGAGAALGAGMLLNSPARPVPSGPGFYPNGPYAYVDGVPAYSSVNPGVSPADFRGPLPQADALPLPLILAGVALLFVLLPLLKR